MQVVRDNQNVRDSQDHPDGTLKVDRLTIGNIVPMLPLVEEFQ